ncbi:MAG: hypothetical protein M1365_08925, partial [Actinobacteria bacterium]|nr:hypothetical protein [Actinomycetota bacterium]
MIGKPYPKLPKAKLISSFSSAYSSVTCYGAIEAYRKIEELYSSYQGNPPKEITDGWKPLIDGAAVLGMGDILEKINYKTISV